VFSFLEAAKLPLSQGSSNAPFSTANPAALLSVMEDLLETNEAFLNEWESHDLKVPGLTATDLYDTYTKEPLTGIADINGMKLSAPGVLGNWLRGTGANAVDGALTTFYTDVQTGVSDGALTLTLGAMPIKLYEVAPYITRFDAGAAFSGSVDHPHHRQGFRIGRIHRRAGNCHHSHMALPVLIFLGVTVAAIEFVVHVLNALQKPQKSEAAQ
jgi:hypothetical protein